MVSPVGNHSLDCMGSIEQISKFCLGKFPSSKKLTRGYIDPVEKEKVVCEFGTNVRTEVICRDQYQSYCSKPQTYCEKLQKIYAIQLQVIRTSSDEGKLHCHFGE